MYTETSDQSAVRLQGSLGYGTRTRSGHDATLYNSEPNTAWRAQAQNPHEVGIPGVSTVGSCVCESEGGTVEYSRQLLTVQERQLAARVLVVYKCGVTQHVTGASQDTGARSFTAEHERLELSHSYAQQMSTFTVERRCLTTRRRLRLIRPSQVRTHVRTHLSKGRPQQAKVMVSVFVCAPRSSVARAHYKSQYVRSVSLRFVQPRGDRRTSA